MPKDQDLVTLNGDLKSTGAGTDTGLDEPLNAMGDLFSEAVQGLMFQNVGMVDTTVRTAKSLYDDIKKYASQEELLLPEILKETICLYAPLTRTLVFMAEGRFNKARDELAKGTVTCGDAMATMKKYAQLPDADNGILQTYQPILSVFPIIFKGLDAYIRADIVGYQGDIRQYRMLLKEAVAEYRKVDSLPPSRDQAFLALAGLCAANADRLETRVEVTLLWPDFPVVHTTGHKIFIIHGHDEAKWRELRDLLEDRLKLKTVVLIDEPSASEVLISKFEESANDCCYAFALLTPDDFVEKEGKSYFQSRPNVLFELGWFYGHFGRDRVCIVKKAGTVMPSDVAGILSIDFSDNVSEGFMKIEDELKRVGVIKAGAGKRGARKRDAV